MKGRVAKLRLSKTCPRAFIANLHKIFKKKIVICRNSRNGVRCATEVESEEKIGKRKRRGEKKSGKACFCIGELFVGE